MTWSSIKSRICFLRRIRAFADALDHTHRRQQEVFYAAFSDDLPIERPIPRYPNARAAELAHRLRAEAMDRSTP